MSETIIKKQIDLLVLVAGAVLIIPYLYSTATIDAVLLPRFLAWSILTFVLTFIILIKIWRNKKGLDPSIIRRAIFPVFGCYLCVSLISLSKAGNLTEGVFEWLKVFLCFAFLYSSTLIIDGSKDSAKILTKSVVVMGMILAFIGICQYYHLAFNSLPGNDVIYGTMAHRNLFASALFLALPFVLYGVLQFSGKWKIMSFASFTSIFLGIVITETRAIWLAMILATFALAFILALGKKKHPALYAGRHAYYRRLLSMSVIIACVIVFSLLSRDYVFEDKTSNYNLGANNAKAEKISVAARSIWAVESFNERLTIWQKSLHMVKDAPLLGVGLGQWKIALPRYGRIEKYEVSHRGINEVIFQRPHNDYIWVLSETGVPGLACYVSFFLLLIYYTLRIFFRSADMDKKIFAILMLFGLIGYMIISFFSFPRERIFHNVFLMLMTACVVSTYHSLFPAQKKGTGRSALLILNAAALLLTGFGIFFGYARLDSEIHTKEALSARRDKHWARVIMEIDKADSRFYNMDPASTPLTWYKGMANFSLGRTREAFEDFKKANEIHPNHVHVLNNLGTCSAMLNDYRSALDYYHRVLALSPGFKATRANLSAVYNRFD